MNTSKPFLPPQSRSELITGRAKEFIQCAILRAEAGNAWPAAIARSDQFGQRISNIVKGSIPPIASSDSDALSAFNTAASAWVETLRSVGVFDAMLPSMSVVPISQRFGISTTAIVASESNEASGIKVAALSLNGSEPLAPRRCTVVLAATRELLKFSDAGALIDRELRNGVVAGVDNVFLAALVAATTPIPSAGSTVANTATDIEALIDAVPLRSTSRPYFIMDPTAAAHLSLAQTNASSAWPNVTVLGGSILGVPVLVSDQLPSGAALLVDATGIAAASGEIELTASNAADVEMSDAPTMAGLGGSPPAPVPAQLTSMFQTNSTAIRASRYFSFRVLRSGAVASLSGVSY